MTAAMRRFCGRSRKRGARILRKIWFDRSTTFFASNLRTTAAAVSARQKRRPEREALDHLDADGTARLRPHPGRDEGRMVLGHAEIEPNARRRASAAMSVPTVDAP